MAFVLAVARLGPFAKVEERMLRKPQALNSKQQDPSPNPTPSIPEAQNALHPGVKLGSC